MQPLPLVITVSSVLFELYPDPESITSTETKTPFSILGKSLAYLPSPLIVIDGVETYPEPPFNT